MKVVGPRVQIYVLAHEWDPVGFARNQVYWTLMKTRPKAKEFGTKGCGRRIFDI
jgi:hypothetical protein